MPEPSILDARLADIDRRLRMIQSGLQPVADAPDAPDEPVGGPPPAIPEPFTPPAPAPSLIARRLAPPPPRGARRHRTAPGDGISAGDEVAAGDGFGAGDGLGAGDRITADDGVGAADRGEEIAVLIARLSELAAAHERLLLTTQDLLIEQADMLARAAPAVWVAAGPFTDTPALQAFQRALCGLPDVREVAVREYVGSEGVILDVHLRAPIS